MTEPTRPFDELPELMLSMRSIGSRRRMPNEQSALEEAQERYFAPLLDARRTAAKALTRSQVIGTFDGRRITALIDATVRALAEERYAARPPARRAFEAELFEIVEPLREALRSLRDITESSAPAEGSPEQLTKWALWLGQLRVVFRLADSSWPALSVVLVSAPSAAASSRWRRLSRGEDRR